MVLIPSVVLARVRLKQVVASRHLKSHASGRPDISGRPVAGPQQHLQGPVLACLDVLGEVVVLKKNKASTQVSPPAFPPRVSPLPTCQFQLQLP